MTSCVRRRTSSTRCPSAVALASNQSCTVSLVVPAPTNCRPEVPLPWSPDPLPDPPPELPEALLLGLLFWTWLAKASLRESGLNWTVTFLGLSASFLRVSSNSMSWARAMLCSAISGSDSCAFDADALVGDLQLFDGDGAILGVERRGLDLDGQAAREHEAHALGVGPQAGVGQAVVHPQPQIEGLVGHAALERELAHGGRPGQADLPVVGTALADGLDLHAQLQAVAFREGSRHQRGRAVAARDLDREAESGEGQGAHACLSCARTRSPARTRRTSRNRMAWAGATFSSMNSRPLSMLAGLLSVSSRTTTWKASRALRPAKAPRCIRSPSSDSSARSRVRCRVGPLGSNTYWLPRRKAARRNRAIRRRTCTGRQSASRWERVSSPDSTTPWGGDT